MSITEMNTCLPSAWDTPDSSISPCIFVSLITSIIPACPRPPAIHSKTPVTSFSEFFFIPASSVYLSSSVMSAESPRKCAAFS